MAIRAFALAILKSALAILDSALAIFVFALASFASALAIFISALAIANSALAIKCFAQVAYPVVRGFPTASELIFADGVLEAGSFVPAGTG